VEKTVATLKEFPGIDPANRALQTWLKIQQVIVLQESRKGKDKESPEFAAIETQIAAVFEELRLFEKRELSEFALQQIGLYFAGTDNPFLGVPYFEELLARTNPEAQAFKGPAEMELGKIEMRAADPAKVQSARERFRRIVVDASDDSKPLKPQAYLNLADLHMKEKEWKDALEALDVINKEKEFFGKDRAKLSRRTPCFSLSRVAARLAPRAAGRP
jgi:tetratricopeptide (TPR) repeat protein